jgi:inner membrane protein
VGAALAELACGIEYSSPPRPALAKRRLFLAAGILASNLPDLDLLATGLSPEPLGYLLHHRGHTHTVAGLVAQGLIAFVICLMPPLRRAIRTAGAGRFWTLVGASLAFHLVLDSWNTYGVHPFAPFDPRWYYGDAIFIFEPWLWLLLGGAAAANARRRWIGVAVAALVAALWIALTATGVLPVPALVALMAGGAVVAWWARDRTRWARAAMALAGSALFAAGMFGLAAVARAQTRAAIAADPRGAEVEVVVNPNPGWPLCWAVIAIENDADVLVYRRGTLSLLPGVHPPVDCPSHRIEGMRGGADGAALAWADERRQSLRALRDRGRRDCCVRAWLQFGRAPFVQEGAIADLRFESGPRGNFTAMAVSDVERACPSAMTSWAMPRADVLTSP